MPNQPFSSHGELTFDLGVCAVLFRQLEAWSVSKKIHARKASTRLRVSARRGVDASRSDFCLAKQSKNGARAGWRTLCLGKWTPVTAGCDGGDTPVWPLRYRAVPMFRLENNRCGKSFFPMGEVGEAQRRRMLGVVCSRGTPPPPWHPRQGCGDGDTAARASLIRP